MSLHLFDRLAAQRPLTKSELRAVAHHEAGHAIAAMVLDFTPVEYVVVGRHTNEDGALIEGVVHFEGGDFDLGKFTRNQLYKNAVGSWAGPLAELHDQRHRINRELENREEYLHEGGAKDDRESAEDSCITAAARDLGVTLEDGDYIPREVREAADKLAEQTFLAAQKLVEDHWHYIRKLAIMLQQRGKVTGEQIWDLLTTPDHQEAA